MWDSPAVVPVRPQARWWWLHSGDLPGGQWESLLETHLFTKAEGATFMLMAGGLGLSLLQRGRLFRSMRSKTWVFSFISWYFEVCHLWKFCNREALLFFCKGNVWPKCRKEDACSVMLRCFGFWPHLNSPYFAIVTLRLSLNYKHLKRECKWYMFTGRTSEVRVPLSPFLLQTLLPLLLQTCSFCLGVFDPPSATSSDFLWVTKKSFSVSWFTVYESVIGVS